MDKIKFLIGIATILSLSFSCNYNNKKSDAYGNFESTEITIASEANGKLLKFDLEEGQIIKTGDISGIIDTTDLILKKEQLQIQKKVIETKFDNIKSQIEVLEQQKKNLEIDKNRIEKLFKDEAATQKQIDDILGNINLLDKQINLTQVQITSVNREIENINKQIDQINENIKKCYIKNPINATVLAKYVQEGEIATFGKALYKIADLNTMFLRVYVSGSQLSDIKIGQKVEVKIDSSNNDTKSLIGTISWISQNAEFTPKIIQTKEERVNLVYAVKILVINDGSLKIGMPGEANFLKSEK